jgi:hypothetical protein
MRTRARIALVLVLATAAAALSGCAPGTAASIDAIESVTYSQTQAVEDFDEGEYVVEGDDLAPLKELMRDHRIDPATYAGGGEACPGSIATDVSIAFDDGTPDSSFALQSGCDDGFATEAGIWLVNYTGQAQTRENGYRAIEYSQYQAVDGYDLESHRQDDPAEIARFVALLERYDIDPDGYVSSDDEGCIGGVWSAVSLFDLEEPEAHVVARMEIDTCGDDDGFDAEATALVTEWHDSVLAG